MIARMTTNDSSSNSTINKQPHHERQELCRNRVPYRQGRKLTAVKVSASLEYRTSIKHSLGSKFQHTDSIMLLIPLQLTACNGFLQWSLVYRYSLEPENVSLVAKVTCILYAFLIVSRQFNSWISRAFMFNAMSQIIIITSFQIRMT